MRVWHDDGVMSPTWGGRATPAQFAETAEAGYQRRDRMLHSKGGTQSREWLWRSDLGAIV